MKTKLVIVLSILMFILSGCTNFESDEPALVEVIEPEVIAEKDSPCDFSKDVELRPGVTYDQFGSEEFDTVVCGYFSHQEEEIFEEMYDIAYLNVVEFMEDEFRQSLDAGFDMGNTVNALQNGQTYALNLGCYEKGKIIGTNYENPSEEYYFDQKTMDAILNSTPEKPVSVILSYGFHEGRGCTCCNLMHDINLY